MREDDNNLSPQIEEKTVSNAIKVKTISVPFETVQAYYALPFMNRINIPQKLTAIAS